MPPKIKTSRETILAAAFEIIKNDGTDAITAKSVSAKLGTSVAPIFRVFQTIEELKSATVTTIHHFYIEYLQNYPHNRSVFFTYGLAYISFAKEYPHLFDTMMESGFFTPDAVGREVSDHLTFIADSAAELGHLEEAQAQELFYHMWLYTHGIACLVCKNSLALTDTDIQNLLVTAYQSFLRNYH